MPRLEVPILALVFLVLGSMSADAIDGASMLKVVVDNARVLKIDRAAATIIVGNPSIVDVAVHDSKTLILTGKSYGITNIVVLDAGGAAVIDEQVVVSSSEAGTVRVFRQAQRVTMACAPECEPTVTIGDDVSAFQTAIGQYSARQTMATEASK